MITIHTRSHRTLGFVIVFASLTIQACSMKPATIAEKPSSDECLLLPPSSVVSDSISLLLESRSPVREVYSYPLSYGKLTYRQLYENLVFRDCSGRFRPALAPDWQPEEGAALWRFDITDGLSFSDGSPVSADRIAESLGQRVRESAMLDTIWSEPGYIHVRPTSMSDELPSVLASPLFGLAMPGASSDWPAGTGPYTATRRSPHPTILSPRANDERPVLTIEIRGEEDPRDLLARGTDLMITADADVIRYARTAGEFDVVAMDFDVIYALISTSRFIEPEVIDTSRATEPDAGASLFTHGAVRADVRAPTEPYWWNGQRLCRDIPETANSGTVRPSASFYSSGLRRILYDNTDPVARDIAQRIVALSLENPDVRPETGYLAGQIPGFLNGSAPLTASGERTGPFLSSLSRGSDFAYVVPLVSRPHEPCIELAYLMRQAPWLAAGEKAMSTAIFPLLETRSYLIARDNHPALSVDWYGHIVIGNRPNR